MQLSLVIFSYSTLILLTYIYDVNETYAIFANFLFLRETTFLTPNKSMFKTIGCNSHYVLEKILKSNKALKAVNLAQELQELSGIT